MAEQGVLGAEAEVEKVNGMHGFLHCVGRSILTFYGFYAVWLVVRPFLSLLCLLSEHLFLSLQGEMARMASFVGAIAIADLVKSTLGPKGMDKILQSVGGLPVNFSVSL